MKTIMMRTFATGIVASALLFTSCKKEEGPKGDTGEAGSNGTVATHSDGFIKGNISGTRQDGTAFNEAFEYKTYSQSESGRLDSNSVASYNFNIFRSEGDIVNPNYAEINVTTTSKTATTGNITLSQFAFTKSMGSNKKFEFMLTGSPSASITGLSYNTSSGMFTGNFSINVNGFQNTTGNTATISGSFEATMTQIYNFIHAGNGTGTSLKH
jgi:hypothetical protein